MDIKVVNFLREIIYKMDINDRLFIGPNGHYEIVPDGTLVRGPGQYFTMTEVILKLYKEVGNEIN